MAKNKVKTVSIQQPFAELICLGVMDVINVNFKTSYRGICFIHATCDNKSFKPNEEQFNAANHIKEFNFDNNAIIGQVEITDLVENHPSIWTDGQRQFLFKNPILFEKPIRNVKGRGMIWYYTPTI